MGSNRVSLEKCRVNTNLGRTRVSFDFAHAHLCVLWSCLTRTSAGIYKKNGLDYRIQYSKTSFEKNCFSAWASTLNMGLINKVDMVCLSPVGYGV